MDNATQKMRPEDSDFIPEVELDENGQSKRKPYKQKPHEPLTDYGG